MPTRPTRSARLRGKGWDGDTNSGRLIARFVGRAAQLDQFIAAVSEDPRSAARIVGVSGAAGAGKSRFVEEALGQLSRSGRPVAAVKPAVVPGLNGAALLRAFAVKLPIGGHMLSAAISRFAQDPAAKLDDSSARALINALFHENYDCGVERRGFIRPKFQRLAIVLDDFDLLPADAAAWLAEIFLPRLDEVRAHLDYVLLLIGEQPLAAALEPVAWNALPMRFFAIEIPPFSEAESIELLAAFARRAAEARSCHQIGEGLPGAMLELLRHRTAPLDDLGVAINRCSGMQADVLLTIAALGYASAEGLRLVLGEAGMAGAGAVLEAAPVVPIFGSLRSGGLWLPGAIARLVLERLGGRNPELARRAADTAAMLDELAQHFPTEEDRVRAARLALFSHFSPAALTTCFGAEEGELLIRFARTRGAAFEETPAGNLRFAEGVRPPLERYAARVEDPARSATREKITRLWSERAAEIGAELERSTETLKAMERDRDELLKELESARGQVVRSETENRQEWRARIDRDVVRIGASLAANGLGVACFWVALFTDNQRLTFLLLGAILIGIGIGTPALNRGRGNSRSDHTHAAVAALHRRQQERVGEARGVVDLIEARIGGLQQRLANERRKCDKLRAAAEEPYL
ncbi:MAG: ATP-binding protein [Opitutaceae bacterium]